MISSFVICLLLFVAVGLSSAFKARKTSQDYYLASRSVAPWLVGLSAVATNNSGYMFIGAIGYTYVTGLASIWLMLGWISGDFMASLYVHHRLRDAAARSNASSYAGILSNWWGVDKESSSHYTQLRRLAAVITLMFLLTYASAQLLAGSKALSVLFGWPIWVGSVTGAIMVAAYCFAGGIRASIWTDAAQSIVMMVAMALLLFVAIDTLGGLSTVRDNLNAIPGFMTWYPEALPLPGIVGGILFAASWLFAGLSVIGQPHIMIRFVTLADPRKMLTARVYYYFWFTAFYAMAIGVGMLARLYLDNPASFDEELALPMMAQQLLSPAMAGLVLAGIFAATMSTADSLILSCSSALSNDLLPRRFESTTIIKLSTLGITLLALLLTFSNQQSVFALVIMAWSGLASAFAPLLIILCMGKNPTEKQAIIMVLTGLATAILWRWLGLHNAVYEGMPGILSGLLIYALSERLGSNTALTVPER
ncbi:MAG: sodium/proline symporter [Pseudomonadales bacterium]|nr:sodium/proline symporter [Pseudomonadales bacterium]